MSDRLDELNLAIAVARQVLQHALQVQLDLDPEGQRAPRGTDRAIIDGDLVLARAFALAGDVGGAEVVVLAELLADLALESATGPVNESTGPPPDLPANGDQPAWRPLARAMDIDPLEQDLARVETAILGLLDVPGDPQVTEATTYLVAAGGKRLRPLLVLLGSYAGLDDELRPAPDAAIEIAAAIETLHIFTLYHDDVIDRAATRRGVPTAVRRWGERSAIDLGNVLCARSFGCAGRLGQRYAKLMAAALDEICRGQGSELTTTFDADRSEHDYLASIGGKTAFLMGAAARLGAMTVIDDDDPLLDELWASVHDYGVAFQVIDDLLDLVGSEDQIKKPVGTDISEGVYTLPVILALREDPGLRDLLTRQPNPAQIEQVRARTAATGAIAAAVRFAEGRCRAARETMLASSRIHPRVRRALTSFEDAIFAPLVAAGVEVRR